MVTILTKENSIANHYLVELRDINIQQDRMRFRRNLERPGEIIAYEISKTLDYEPVTVQTPLGIASHQILQEQPVLATIMRAGLPFHQGMLNVFDHADSAFVSAYRMHSKDEGDFKVEVDYMSCPDLNKRELILVDPMLATGSSMVKVHRALLKNGAPSHNHIVTLLATKEGISLVRKNSPPNTTIWVGAIDDELTAQAYIVPGLGDAGDLCYGAK